MVGMSPHNPHTSCSMRPQRLKVFKINSKCILNTNFLFIPTPCKKIKSHLISWLTAISLALSPILVALSSIILKKIRQCQSLDTNTNIDKLFNCRTLLDCLPLRPCPYIHLTVFNILLPYLTSSQWAC